MILGLKENRGLEQEQMQLHISGSLKRLSKDMILMLMVNTQRSTCHNFSYCLKNISSILGKHLRIFCMMQA
uniref:Uncharacterized protein n=1 Tax=uncultured delta proteobacterium HF0200_19J16 TaxID=710831 RepID=E0XUB4_9DELT|nr:hypothetical protein [uncultured delta proteobacterium HF0200_19J16]